MKHRLTSLIFSCVSAVCVVQAAETADEKGYVTGSFETNTNYYLEDQLTAATVPDGNFGSNNYLKVDYITAASLPVCSWRIMLRLL